MLSIADESHIRATTKSRSLVIHCGVLYRPGLLCMMPPSAKTVVAVM
jgi:hypothetical protein